MYTKLLVQVVLLSYLSENICVPVKAAESLTQSDQSNVNNNKSLQNQKLKLQPTINDPAVPSPNTITQQLPANQQTPTISYPKDSKTKNIPELVSTTGKLENVKNEHIKQTNNNFSKPETLPYNGSLNNKMSGGDYYAKEDEDEEEEEEEEEGEEEGEEEEEEDYLEKTNQQQTSVPSTKGSLKDINQQSYNKLLNPETLPPSSLSSDIEDESEYYDDEENPATSLNQIEAHRKPSGSIILGLNSGLVFSDTPKQSSSTIPIPESVVDSHLLPPFSQNHDRIPQNIEASSPNKLKDYSFKSADGQYQYFSGFNVDDETPEYNPFNNYETQQYSSPWTPADSYSSEETEKEVFREDDGFNNSQLGDKEKILNGYTTIKNILYMLHDYASSTFNWIINKINNQMEKIELNQKDKISSN